ncbi:MAG: hypothetical protein BV458_03540 [Thermoplasmata archaeon M9B2D]|nr:MAG: hypothetical protein BV458_03540 [Thermoplasmata archaeon M9B2D]
MSSYKNQIPQNIIKQFVVSYPETDYDITGVDESKAIFMFRYDLPLSPSEFELLQEADYTVITEGEQKTLKITNDDLLQRIDTIQVNYQLEDESGIYEGETLEGLIVAFNKLVESYQDTRTYTINHLMIGDDLVSTLVLPKLGDGQLWVYDEENDRFVGTSFGDFDIDAIVDEVVEKAKAQIDFYVENSVIPMIDEYVVEDALPTIDEYIEDVSKPEIDDYVDGTLADLVLYWVQGTCNAYTGADPNGIADVIVDREDVGNTEIIEGVAPLTARPNGQLLGTSFVAEDDFTTTIVGVSVDVSRGDYLSWFGEWVHIRGSAGDFYTRSEIDYMIANLQSQIDDKADTDHLHPEYAPISHTHIESDITDLDKYTKAETDTALGLKANITGADFTGDVTTTGKLVASGDVVAYFEQTSVRTLVEIEMDIVEVSLLRDKAFQLGMNNVLIELDAKLVALISEKSEQEA